MKSMTGFGRANYENDGRMYNIEIKSVNHRYCDISVKLPRSISYLEEKIKKASDYDGFIISMNKEEFEYLLSILNSLIDIEKKIPQKLKTKNSIILTELLKNVEKVTIVKYT